MSDLAILNTFGLSLASNLLCRFCSACLGVLGVDSVFGFGADFAVGFGVVFEVDFGAGFVSLLGTMCFSFVAFVL